MKATGLVRYGVALLAAAGTTVFAAVFSTLVHPREFFLFFLAVGVTARYGGLGPALVATALGELTTAYLFLEPYYSFAVANSNDRAGIIAFPLVAVAISILVNRLTQAETSMREQGDRLRITLASIGEAVIVTDRRGRITFMNPVAESVTGWTAHEAAGKPLERIFHIVDEATRRPVENPVARVMRDGAVVGLANHTALVARDGTVVTLDDRAAPIRSADGAIMGVVLVFHDVTERRKAERRTAAEHAVTRILAEAATLREAAPRLLQAICESLRWEMGVLWTVDRTADVLRCVDAWRVPSVDVAEFEATSRARTFVRGIGLPGRVWAWGKPLWLVDVVSDPNFPRAAIAARAGLRAAFGFPIVLGNEVHGVMEVFTRESREPDDDLVLRLSRIGSQVGQFIERKRAEDALRASEERHRVIAETASDAVLTIDEESTILFVNRAAERMFGYGAAEMVGQKLTMLMPETLRPRHQTALARYLKTGERERAWEGMQLPGMRRNGEEIALEISIGAFTRDGRHFFTGIARDITERWRAEAEREQLLARERAARAEAEAANRAKDEFLATLSHELRTPLTPMLLWVRLLRSRKLDDATIARALGAMERNTKHQARLIEDILDLSRIVAGKLRLDLREVCLPEVITTAIDLARPTVDAKGLRLDAALDPTADRIVGDPARLRQVIWNLLSNAIKFTPRGGRVEVQLERDDGWVRIRVSDTGQGIGRDFLPYVFDRFRQADSTSTRAHGGLGLGLAIVRHLVELHGGTVRAESEGEERGATFTVSLPIGAARAAAAASGQPAGADARDRSPALDGVRVLVVDDEPETRELLTLVLEHCNAQVTAVSSAEEALRAIERSFPDVLVCDIGMPGEDGYSLIRKVRGLEAERGTRLLAVALTAYASAEDRRRALDAGFQIHVAKPVEPTELAAVVAGLTRRDAPPAPDAASR